MTPDLMEERLRSALHDATTAQDGAYLDLDPSLVLGHGRRAVRRRRIAAGASVAAATVVVGLVGYSALGTGVDRTSTPAGSTATRGAVTAVLDTFSDLSDSTTGDTLPIPGPRRVAVTVDPTARPDLVFWDVADDGSRRMLGGSSLDGVDPLGATWGTTGEGSHVVVGLVPEQARAISLVTPITDEGGGMSTSVEEVVPGTGRKAFGTRFSDAAEAAAVSHVLWWGADGSVHDESGALVPSVSLGDADDTTVYVAPSFDRMGTFAREGGGSAMTLDASRNSSGRPVISMARGETGALTGLFVAVVPDGTTPGAMAPVAGTTVTEPPTVVDLPGSDRSVLWATFTATRSAPGSGYSSVTWTEPGGRVVTERP
ncbi:hypothetical protein [Oryzobacter terrae]|uniref:hypothetical protein n=1 Tax=Oryzobacter terrae TaxID=1620385 RepID=UPI003672CD34